MAANIPEILARLNAKVGVLTERYGVVKRQRTRLSVSASSYVAVLKT